MTVAPPAAPEAAVDEAPRDDPVDAAPGGGPAPRSRVWRPAALFVLPYLLLGLAWSFSNPPGAAPDESDHLVKALGMASLDIGDEYDGPPIPEDWGHVGLISHRNRSISRVVSIPARLDPSGFRCTHTSLGSAACLPDDPPARPGQVRRVTPMGAYPPFLYVPMGVAAQSADSATGAFLAARVAALLMACGLLLIGAAHMIRWLGRWSLLGAFVGLTPLAVFCMSVVSTSGAELAAAFAVSTVAVVTTRRPESLDDPWSLATLALSGTVLALSRQLGVATLGMLGLVIVTALGRHGLVRLWQAHRVPLLTCSGVLAVATLAVLLWERAYDHPSNTGAPSAETFRLFDKVLVEGITSAIGVFGWLNAPMPRSAIAMWVLMFAVLCGTAVLLGAWRDVLRLLGVVTATLVVAYVVYAVVFAPVGAGIQGRHWLPMIVFVPLLAGVVVVERLSRAGLRTAVRRLFVTAGLLAGFLQFVGLYENSRRYATGLDAPLDFLGDPDWSPTLGWVPLLVLGLAGSVALTVVAARCRPDGPRPASGPEVRHVEG